MDVILGALRALRESSIAEKPIQNCEMRFRFQCPMQWDALQETTEAGVRACSQCQKRVYLCQSKEEATQHAREGHCIAVPRWVTSPRDFPNAPERVQALARRHGLATIDLRNRELDLELVKLVPWDVARRDMLIVVSREWYTLTVAVSDPANRGAIDDLKLLTGCNVERVVASPRDIQEALDRSETEDPDTLMLGAVSYDEESGS